jgi:hypothetical protein
MNGLSQIVVTLFGSALAVSPPAAGWEVAATGQISFREAGEAVYKLDCSGPDLVVTQFGVTQLVDMQTNRQVADDSGSALPAGASVMALATDKSEPNMVAASAVRNAGRGWDMTIRLAKRDPAFLTLPRAGMVSLFTTGFTRAVTLDKSDRKLFAAFVTQCAAE